MDGQVFNAAGVLKERLRGQEAEWGPRRDQSDECLLASACRVAEGDGAGVLDEIRSPGCAAAIWRREPPSKVQAWVDALEPEMMPETRFALSPHRVAGALCLLFDQHGLPASECRTWLVRDIAERAGRFARIMKAGTLRLRLDVIGDNACRKFHLDNVAARLLCTYRGRGTQYGLAQPGGDPSIIHELPTGAVGLFRGALWPSTEGTGIVHRSPPISGSNETRLLLVIDPTTDVS